MPDAHAWRSRLLTVAHRRDQVLAVQPAAGEDGGDVDNDDGKHQVRQRLMDILPAVGARLLQRNPAAHCDRGASCEKGDNGQSASWVMPGEVLRRARDEGTEIREGRRRTTDEIREPGVACTNDAPEDAKYDKARCRVASGDMYRAPDPLFGSQVSADKANNDEPVKNADGNVPDEDFAAVHSVLRVCPEHIASPPTAHSARACDSIDRPGHVMAGHRQYP